MCRFASDVFSEYALCQENAKKKTGFQNISDSYTTMYMATQTISHSHC